ncbi:MAG: metalloregulator ArsR/SmtB family transcription factor [Gammaproteobacteria bacterium]|nr:metalloregulator ArsR/SmtB family transcription factor [Gammaproteobacteria bacterium]
MSSLNFKQDLFDQFARIGKAVSNGRRLELLELLAQGRHNVETLAAMTNMSVANTSQHLQSLRQAGLVSASKTGQHVYYDLSSPRIIDLLTVLRDLAEANLNEVHRLVQQYLDVKDPLEPLPRDDLVRRAREGKVTVLDVRPAEEYEAGHIQGAINIPADQLDAHLEQLPRDQEIVAYCRGPYCVLAFDAVQKLRDMGFEVRRLEDGYPEWKQAGLPTDE